MRLTRRRLLLLALWPAVVGWQALLGGWLAPNGGQLLGDSSEYLHLATHILEGRGYTYDPAFLSAEQVREREARLARSRHPGLLQWAEDREALRAVAPNEQSGSLRPICMRQPLYPLLLAGVFALVGFRPLMVFLVQALLIGGVCLLSVLLAERLWPRSAVGGVVTAALVGLFPPLAVASSLIMADALMAFAVVSSLYCAVVCAQTRKWQYALLTGLAISAAGLTKPLGLLSGAALALIVGVPLARSRPASLGALLAGAGLPLLVWSCHNQATTGSFTPTSTEAGYNIWAGTYDPLSPLTVVHMAAPTDRAQEIAGDDYYICTEANSRFLAEARRRCASDPLGVAARGASRVLRVGLLDVAGGRSYIAEAWRPLYRVMQALMLLAWVAFGFAYVRAGAGRGALLCVPITILVACLASWCPGRALVAYHPIVLAGAAHAALALACRSHRLKAQQAAQCLSPEPLAEAQTVALTEDSVRQRTAV